jgi:16S rRNA G527 N7-methylase RsmG
MKSLKLFEDGLSKLNIEFDSNQLSQIETFYNEINLFNPTYRLVNATSNHPQQHF